MRGKILTLDIPEDQIHLHSDFRALFLSAHYFLPRIIFIMADPRLLGRASFGWPHYSFPRIIRFALFFSAHYFDFRALFFPRIIPFRALF